MIIYQYTVIYTINLIKTNTKRLNNVKTNIKTKSSVWIIKVRNNSYQTKTDVELYRIDAKQFCQINPESMSDRWLSRLFAKRVDRA